MKKLLLLVSFATSQVIATTVTLYNTLADGDVSVRIELSLFDKREVVIKAKQSAIVEYPDAQATSKVITTVLNGPLQGVTNTYQPVYNTEGSAMFNLLGIVFGNYNIYIRKVQNWWDTKKACLVVDDGVHQGQEEKQAGPTSVNCK